MLLLLPPLPPPASPPAPPFAAAPPVPPGMPAEPPEVAPLRPPTFIPPESEPPASPFAAPPELEPALGNAPAASPSSKLSDLPPQPAMSVAPTTSNAALSLVTDRQLASRVPVQSHEISIGANVCLAQIGPTHERRQRTGRRRNAKEADEGQAKSGAQTPTS
jgi:hypothetical protein